MNTVEHTTGEILRQERIKKGLSQRQLAAIMGVSSAYISQCERDLRKPKKETLMKFAEALGSDVYSIIDFDTASSLLSNEINDLQRKYGCYIFDLLNVFQLLNDQGQLEALKRIEEMADLPKYQRDGGNGEA